ncbi:Phage DNA packaging protein [Pseudomonas syringae pv. maculicola]|nr:Phage DNA packaging protein [Pseudomonas syringae pv. maculicola]
MQQASLNGKKESSRDRLDRVRANREELALAKELGEVVIASDMIQRFEAMIMSAKVELLNTFPDVLAAELSARYGIEVDDLLIREPIEAILRRLSDYDNDADSVGDSDESRYPEGLEEDGE